MSSRPDLKLDWCSHEAAKYAVEHWHYSKTLPTPPLVRVGVWEASRFIGVVLFGRGANNNIGKPYKLEATEVCELVRVALDKHEAPVSRIVAIAVRMIRNKQALRLCVSYADPSEGHHGGIYQAGNWIYAGKTTPDRFYVTHSGKRVHSRMVCESGFKSVYGARRRVLTPQECRSKHVTAGKHRYLMPLDAEMRDKVALLAKPYPKRERSRENAAAPPRAEGGEIPTRSLHADAT
jgi:hypothetical protein